MFPFEDQFNGFVKDYYANGQVKDVFDVGVFFYHIDATSIDSVVNISDHPGSKGDFDDKNYNCKLHKANDGLIDFQKMNNKGVEHWQYEKVPGDQHVFDVEQVGGISAFDQPGL